MFVVTATKNALQVTGSELMTSGSVNINFVQVVTSNDWRGLNATIIFQTRRAAITYDLGIDDGTQKVVAVPWEVLQYAGETINVGIYGVTPAAAETQVVLPTIWGTIGKVTQGVYLSSGTPPTPSNDMFSTFIDKLDGFEGIITDIQQNGIYEHTKLRERDADEQHPISAITGLQDKLDEVIMPSDVMTLDDLQNMLNKKNQSKVTMASDQNGRRSVNAGS